MPGSTGQIKVTQVKSTSGCTIRQKETLKTLGLRKIGSERILKDNKMTQGATKKVLHLIKVTTV